jgi:hypothetical protein
MASADQGTRVCLGQPQSLSYVLDQERCQRLTNSPLLSYNHPPSLPGDVPVARFTRGGTSTLTRPTRAFIAMRMHPSEEAPLSPGSYPGLLNALGSWMAYRVRFWGKDRVPRSQAAGRRYQANLSVAMSFVRPWY